ncbi:MAG: hypothetical protein H7346_18975 [Burkholderiaceae bacterium]|nr:hypothetical protein [Burkholderiaceae bacterium]
MTHGTGRPGSPAPEDPDVSVPQRAPPHEPPIPVKEPIEPDRPEDSPIKAVHF